MVKILKWAVDRTLVPLGQYISDNISQTAGKFGEASDSKSADALQVFVENLAPELQTGERWRYPHMISRVLDKEMEECVEFIRKHLHTSYLAPTDTAIREYCLERIPAEGLVLEFGVFQATSTNHIADKLTSLQDKRLVHGFDSFEGLQTDSVGWVWTKGRFNLDGNLPIVRENIRLYKGWIDETLPVFLSDYPSESIAFLHVDVDLYEPTKVILESCKNRLRSGSIILFDELIGYAGWRFHEFKALNEVFDPEEYEFVAFSDSYQAAIRIK